MTSDFLVGIALGVGLTVCVAYAAAWLAERYNEGADDGDEQDGWGI